MINKTQKTSTIKLQKKYISKKQNFFLNLKHQIFNHLMINGNKETCEKIFLKSSKLLQKSLFKNHKVFVKIAIINSSPIMNIMQIKINKKNKKENIKEYPYIIDSKIRKSLAIKFIVEILNQKKKKSKSLYLNLLKEFVKNSQNNSNALKKKEDLQKKALLNKKYLYYRWF
jgi:ribosomal protein S7